MGEPYWGIWECEWTKGREVAYFEAYVPGISDGCDPESPLMPKGEVCHNTLSPYSIGTVSQWGNDKNIELSPWPRLSGMANIGWFLSYTLGAPEMLDIRNLQVPRGHFVVVAVEISLSLSLSISLLMCFSLSLSFVHTLPHVLVCVLYVLCIDAIPSRS